MQSSLPIKYHWLSIFRKLFFSSFPSSLNRFYSHAISLLALVTMTYSDSTVDNATIFFDFDAQEIVVPLNVKTCKLYFLYSQGRSNPNSGQHILLTRFPSLGSTMRNQWPLKYLGIHFTTTQCFLSGSPMDRLTVPTACAISGWVHCRHHDIHQTAHFWSIRDIF